VASGDAERMPTAAAGGSDRATGLEDKPLTIFPRRVGIRC
jgi:hypothetical protein